MKFSGVITSDRSDVHAKGQGQRSKVKVTEVTTLLYRFRTATPVWIHVWWSNDAYSLIMLRRGALLFFKVICQISRSHGSKNCRIWPRLGISGLYLQFEFTNGYKTLHKVLICNLIKIFSCDQAALQMGFSVCLSVHPSVCLSVRPSVRHTFLTMFPSSYHHEIFRSYYQWQKWRPCKRPRSEVKGQGHRGHNPTLPFPDCNSSLNSRMMIKWCI